MILASQSPRRLELLRELGIDPVVMPARIDERPRPGESPTALVARLSLEKAQSVWEGLSTGERTHDVVAADTVVWIDGMVLGKPPSVEDAMQMLGSLSGRVHHVSTGVCLIVPGRVASSAPICYSFVETTDVEFYELSDAQAEAYARSKEPSDKAGAYGIQGRGRLLVKRIDGDYYNVVGLPVTRVLRELDRLHGNDRLVVGALSASQR